MRVDACAAHVYTSALEDAGVAVAVSLSKGLHHAVYLLRLPRQTEAPQELSARRHRECGGWGAEVNQLDVQHKAHSE